MFQKIQRWFTKKQTATIVLMYHRVAQRLYDPWELCVSPAHFEEQLQVLKKTGLVVPMNELADGITNEQTDRPSIVITFDDGYLDNFLVAKPILEKYQLPATFYISNKHIGTEKGFWWDELAIVCLKTAALPQTLHLDIAGSTFYFLLGEETDLSAPLSQRYETWSAYGAIPGLRAKLYLALWEFLSPLPYTQQQQVLARLKEWAGLPPFGNISEPCMSESQLHALSVNPLFTIGGHTVTHPALAYHSRTLQRQEIGANKQFLETLTGLPVNTFSYPSNSFTEETIEVLKELRFQTAFTTAAQPVNNQQDVFHIGRFQVNDWPASKFETELKRFMSL